jgi:hypothetical protein
MIRLPKVLSLIALAGSVVPAALYMFKLMGEGPMKLTMLLATILWFAAAPFWLKGGEQ